MKDEDNKIISKAFGSLLVVMAENKTDSIELIFNFNKCKAKFKVDLLELEKVEVEDE